MRFGPSPRAAMSATSRKRPFARFEPALGDLPPLSNARAAARIDDDHPEVPTEMFERLHPEVLRPFPACSIAQIQAEPDSSSSARTIARGTEFDVDFATLKQTALAGTPNATSVTLHLAMWRSACNK